MSTSKLKKALRDHRERQGKEYHRVVLEDESSSHNAEALRKGSIWKKLVDDFADCKLAILQFPPDIYFIFYLKFLESYSYFALSQIFVIYLHNEFGVSDLEAGAVYGMW